MKNLLRLPIFLVSCLLLSLLVHANAPADVSLTEAERREQQVVERFWTLLERTPRRGTSFDRVYGHYVDTGRLEELMKRCRELTEANPNNAKSWLLLGLVLSRRSDDAATVAALEKAMVLDETDLLAPFYLGETYIAQGRLRDAAETLEKALQRALVSLQKNTTDRAVLSRDVLAILQTLGRVYERFSDRENSNRVWDKLEELFPGDRDILVRIAETLEEEGRFDEALKRYQRLAEMARNDNFARVQYTLAAADIKVRLGEKQSAIDDFETLLEELAGDSWLSRSIRDRVERIFVRQADYAGLAGYYQKRLQKYPNDLDTIRRHAVTLVRLARTDEAKELLANILERAPSNVPLRLALIDLLVADKDFEAVDRHYAKIDELEPNNSDHISQWGLATLENTKLDESARKATAIRIWSRLLTARPDDPAVLIMVADLANGAKIPDEAERFYKKAVALRPNDPSYKEYLGYFYHHRERREEAIATLRQIAEGDRRTPSNLAQLGGIFRSLGYAEETLIAMKEAVLLDDENFELRMQYADLLFTNDKTDDAEVQYFEAEKLALNKSRNGVQRNDGINEEFARFLNAYTRLLQSTGKLQNAAEALTQKVAHRPPGDGSAVADLHPGDVSGSPSAEYRTGRPAVDRLPNAEEASDFWRLATYQSALGLMGSATESIEAAMELAPNANILLDAAASIFEKGHDQVRAAAIYEKLASADPPRRVEHLKRLANLRRDLGEMDKAIDTARLVMATGAGNAANSRFFADMLLSIGRRADGIEILRRAVRLDPTDTNTLTILADVLFDTNEIDEALEIQWRIFERTEDLQGKIGAVMRMSTFYQQAQRFNQLIERLRQTANDTASRRVSAFCLAQGYVTVSDFEMARQTLEMLLLGDDTDDTLLLSQLSRISELQGDIPTAIRYQEMLCDRLQGGQQTGQENERLLSLYQQSGEREKAIEHLLKFFVEKGDLREQVQVIDDLLSREDYESAQRILDRIEGRNPRQWELMYRRLMLEFWQDDLEEATATARRILALDTPREQLSAKRQHALQATQRPGTTAQTPQQQQMARMFGQGYQPWGFGDHQGYNRFHVGAIAGMNISLQQTWNVTHGQMMPVLFRDRLRLEQHFFYRGMSSSSAEPPKPQWEPETFADARLAAAAWLLRIAMQEDIDAFREANPTEEGKQEKPPTAQNGLTLDRFTEAIDAWRSAVPSDATDVTRIEERLRLEYFLQVWSQTVMQAAASFPEGNYAKLLFTLGDETADGRQQTAADNNATNELRSQLEFRLAMLGEKEWLPTAYNLILRDLTSNRVSALQRFDLEKEFDQAVQNAPPEFREKFSEDEIAFAKQSFPKMLELMQKMLGKQGTDSLTVDQKVDLIFQCWQLALESAPGNMTFQMVITSYPHIRNHFRSMGREQDADRLEALVERAAEANPAIDVMIAHTMMNVALHTPDPTNFLGSLGALRLLLEGHDDAFENYDMADSDEEEEMDRLVAAFEVFVGLVESAPVQVAAVDFDKQFETFQSGVERLKRAVRRINEQGQPATPANPMMRPTELQFQSPEMMAMTFDNAMMGYLQRVITSVTSELGLTPAAPDGMITVSIPGGGTAQVPVAAIQQVALHPGVVVLPQPGEAEKKPLTPEQLERIAAAEKEIYRLLDYYFEQMNELEGSRRQTADGSRGAATASPMVVQQRRPAPPSLLGYKDHFERGREIQSYELDNILQGQTLGSPIRLSASSIPANRTLLIAHGFFKMVDDALKNAPTQSAALVQRFDTYLTQKATDGTDADKTRIENVRTLIAEQTTLPSGRTISPAMLGNVNNELNVDAKINELETEAKELAEKGEKLDFRKTFVLALLHKQKGNKLKAVEYLDALPITASGDLRYREQLVLKWAAGMITEPTMRKRAETAVERLLRYQLNGNEMQDLRLALRLLERHEEADRIRDRMLATATDFETQRKLLEELRSDRSNRTTQFALKVYRSPAVRHAATARQGDMSRYVRDMALDILQRAGKLDEIVEQVEAQWQSSPGSLDLMIALADIYHKAGRRDDARRVAREISEKLPEDDAAKIQAHANLLSNLGMNDEAVEWNMKALAKNPEQLLQNFWQYEQSFRESNQRTQLLTILKRIRPERLAGQFGNFWHNITEWQRNEATKQAADELLEYVWAMEGVNDADRRQGRADFVRTLAWNPNEAYYPMFREVVLDAVAVRELDEESVLMPGGVVVHHRWENLFSVHGWSQDRVSSIGNAFFDIVAKKGELASVREEFQKAVDAHEAIDAAKRVRTQYQNARLALAVTEIRLKNADAAVKLVEAIIKEENPATRQQQQQMMHNGGEYQVVLAFELATLGDSPAAVELAIRLLEGMLKDMRSSHMEQYILSPLMKFYLRSDRAAEGRTMALDQLREAFRYLKLMGNTQQYQVGNRHYSSWELQEQAVTTSRLLLESDNAFDLMLIYREMYDGQSWVRLARQQNDYRFGELDRISRELEEKISAKDFTANLEQLIPGMSDGEVDRRPLGDGAVLPPGGRQPTLTLGRYITLVRLAEQENQFGESLAGIRLADSLAVIAKEEPERYTAIKNAIEALEKAAPEEPTILIALTCCRLLDGDHAAVESLLRRLVEWSKTRPSGGHVDQQIYLGIWSVLKGTFADETLMAKAEVRGNTETLFQFTGRLVEHITANANEERRTQSGGFSTPVQSFMFDVQRYAPDEIYQKFQPDVDAMVYVKILMPTPGFLTNELGPHRNRIAGQLSEGLTIVPGAVMQVFRTVFANGYPPVEGESGILSRNNAMWLLFVFGRVLEMTKDGGVDSVIVYEALREIVLAEGEEKRPFLVDYDDLGGENGYFRTPAADLVDWAVKAERVDDLKERIASRRLRYGPGTALDVVDLLLALKLGETERSTELIAQFLKGVREGNPLIAKYAAIAAVPAAKPFELSEITEHYPVLIELIDALITSANETVKTAVGRRYGYYMVRSFYDRFAQEAAIPQKTDWLRAYREMTNLDQMDGFLFTVEDRLYREGLEAITNDKLDDAIAVLRYFARHFSYPVPHFRDRGLTEYLTQLQPKLDALDVSVRKELLGNLVPADIAKRGTARRTADVKLTAKQFDLPPLPDGTVVYQNDFEMQTGSEWSIDRRDITPQMEKTFLGEFHSDKVRFRLAGLPEHRFVRIRFDLLMLAGLDGLVGFPREFGVDVWGMEIEGSDGTPGSRPIVSSFSNFHADPNAQTQSFPDDYPLEFGVKPTWFEQLLSDNLWTYNNETFGKGVYHGRHGADKENVLGYEKDAVYAIDLIVPHTSSELTMEFFSKFQDGPFSHGQINAALGESWGLDNFRVEVLTEPLQLDDAALKICFDALIGNDALKSHAARWRLVAAENVAVEYIDRWFKDESNAAKRNEIRKPGNFDLFRIDRVLELIVTPEAEMLRREISPL